METQAATKKAKISKESAQKTLDLFFEYYEIDHEKEALLANFPALTSAIQKGRLEIAVEDGVLVVTQHLKFPPGEVGSYVYGEISGKNLLAMKSKAEGDHYGRIQALLGSLSNLGENAIIKLKGPDMSLANAIGMLFLAV